MDSRYLLPSWLEPLLPDVVAPLLLDVVYGEDGEEFWGVEADGGRRLLGTDLEAAYDAAGGADVLFSDDVCRRYGEEGPDGRHWMLSVPTRDGHNRLLFTFTDADRVAVLADAWRTFPELDARWRADPSFVNAFAWIDTHPAFWIRSTQREPGQAGWRDVDFWGWETSEHMQRVDIRVRRTDDGVVIALETGGHVGEEARWEDDGTPFLVDGAHQTHYHDPRLDVGAPTFEDAVRRLAVAIDAVFDVEGNERPDAPASDSALPEEVEAAMEAHSDSWADVPRIRFADLGARADGGSADGV